MLHKNVGIGDNHPTHNWEYANAAARTGATGFVAGDVHKLALQLDDLSLWILVNTTPTWQAFGVGISTFLGLSDTPASYTGQAGKAVVVNGTENALEFVTGGGGYTNEQAQDAVGTILVDSSTIDFTYDDVGNSITAVTKQQMSITSDASGLKLSGDASSPGNNKVYGTDSSGVKGWKNDPAGSGGRELLTAARTYYVRTDGSDSNTGLTDSSGGAFLTLQKAIDTVCSLDMSIYQVTIQVRSGTYTGTNLLKNYVGALAPIILGDTTTPSNCVISTTANHCFYLDVNAVWIIKGLKLQTTTSGSCLYAISNGSVINFYNIEFGTCANFHMRAETAAVIRAFANYSITGGAQCHHIATTTGIIHVSGFTVNITGVPGFSIAFAYARLLAIIRADSNTYTNAATGVRYDIAANSICSTSAGVNYLPGSIVGSTATGGLYI